MFIFVSALSYEIRKDFFDSPPGERRKADRPGAKCTKLAAEGPYVWKSVKKGMQQHMYMFMFFYNKNFPTCFNNSGTFSACSHVLLQLFLFFRASRSFAKTGSSFIVFFRIHFLLLFRKAFWFIFCSTLRFFCSRAETSRSVLTEFFYVFFLCIDCLTTFSIDSGRHFGSVLGPFWDPKSSLRTHGDSKADLEKPFFYRCKTILFRA